VEETVLKFSQRSARELYLTGAFKGVPDQVARRAMFVFDWLDHAKSLVDIRFIRSLRLTKVKGTTPTRLMVHVQHGYWITFRWVEGGCVDIKIEVYDE
jgi:plasmid maintenance system killer protein